VNNEPISYGDGLLVFGLMSLDPGTQSFGLGLKESWKQVCLLLMLSSLCTYLYWIYSVSTS